MDNNKLIHPKFYFGNSTQQLEFDKVFSKNWLFAGMLSDFLENNSFITLDILDYPIVIQNFNGELRAFQNICPHRFNRIQTKTKGIDFFICGYHNWSFDKEGNVKSIPKKSSFNESHQDFNCLKVKPLRIEIVGKFVFVSLDQNSESIKEYLGVFHDKLLEVSLAIDYNFYFEDDLQNINWKLIVENVVEAYHCPAIHQNTLYNMGFCRKSEVNNDYYNGHSVADYPKSDKVDEGNKLLKYLDNIEIKHDTFRHYFIFPNLLISSTEGTSIYVGNILPVNSEKSILRKRFYSPKFRDNFIPKEAIHKAFLEMVKTSINQILEEDKVILEQIQKNMPFVENTYFLGKEESRINSFHEKYLELI